MFAKIIIIVIFFFLPYFARLSILCSYFFVVKLLLSCTFLYIKVGVLIEEIEKELEAERKKAEAATGDI